MARFWQDLTSEEFRSLDPDRTVTILPVAAIEQHGPHLPVGVDALLGQGVLRRALELVDPAAPILVLPPMPVGKSNEHQAFPGTLTLSAATLTALWTDIGESVHRAGLRRLVIFNAHGGQPQIMDIVARDLRVRLAMFVVCANWFSFGLPDGLFTDAERRHGIHGGAVETAMMRHLHPDLVRWHKAGDFTPATLAWEQEFRWLQAEGPISFGWQTQDLHPSGACGNALAAQPEDGAACIEHAARGLVELLIEVAAFPLNRLRLQPE